MLNPVGSVACKRTCGYFIHAIVLLRNFPSLKIEAHFKIRINVNQHDG